MLRKVPDERLERLLSEALVHPVERRAEVVHQLLSRELLADLTGKASGHADMRVAGLNPEEIGVRSKVDGTLGGRGLTGLVVVVALTGPGDVHGPEDWGLRILIRESATLRDGPVSVLTGLGLVFLAGGFRGALLDEVLVDGYRVLVRKQKLNGLVLTLIERHERVLLHPLQLKCINLRTGSTREFHVLEGLGQRFGLLRHTEDELVVPDIDVVAQKLSALGVRSRDKQVLGAHHVPLEPGGDESVDVLGHGHEDLASKVTALLAAMELVFKVNSSSAVLREKLCQLEHSRQAAVSARFSVSEVPTARVHLVRTRCLRRR